MFLPAGCTIPKLFERLSGGDEAPLSDERKDRAWARLTQLAESDEFVFVKSPLPETAYDEIDKDTKTSMWKEIEEKEIEKMVLAKKKADLLAKYASAELDQQQAETKAMRGE